MGEPAVNNSIQSSKLTFGTNLSADELESLKQTDPVAALELIMSSRGLSEKSPSISTASGAASETSIDVLILELKERVLNVDLFEEIEQNPNMIYEIKALLRKLNTPRSDDSLLSFVSAFEPLLDQFFRELQSITEAANKLSLQATAHSQEWSMVEDSRRRIADIERNAKEENEEVITCNNNIAQWEHQIKELQEKIVAERARKVEAQSTYVSLRAEKKEEAKKALRHWENVEKIMGEIQELTTAKDFAEKKLKYTKDVYHNLKSSFILAFELVAISANM
jgi:chromosome segregation ATPase